MKFKIEKNEDNFFITESLKRYGRGIPISLRKKHAEISLKRSFLYSSIVHPIVLIIIQLIVIYGITANYVKISQPKVKDIEFILTKNIQNSKTKQYPPKIKKSDTKTPLVSSKTPANKINEGEAKSLRKSNINKTPIINNKPKKLTTKAHSETIIPFSKQQHKGSKINKSKTEESFIPAMPKFKPLSSEIGFGAEGTKGYSASGESKRSIIANGEGAGSNGENGNIGTGKRKGGYLASDTKAGIPKTKASSLAKNELTDANLNPYITDLQRKIKRKWFPPKGNANKKVSLFLRIAKDGKLIILNVKDTSEDADTDNAAIKAVTQTQPFRPLPSNYSQNYVDVVLTFDYDVSSFFKK